MGRLLELGLVSIIFYNIGSGDLKLPFKQGVTTALKRCDDYFNKDLENSLVKKLGRVLTTPSSKLKVEDNTLVGEEGLVYSLRPNNNQQELCLGNEVGIWDYDGNDTIDLIIFGSKVYERKDPKNEEVFSKVDTIFGYFKEKYKPQIEQLKQK